MERYSDIHKATIAGIAGNIFLLIIKFIVGFLSKSQALIADAANSAGDIFCFFNELYWWKNFKSS